jgi:hypothetical protein
MQPRAMPLIQNLFSVFKTPITHFEIVLNEMETLAVVNDIIWKVLKVHKNVQCPTLANRLPQN